MMKTSCPKCAAVVTMQVRDTWCGWFWHCDNCKHEWPYKLSEDEQDRKHAHEDKWGTE